MSDGNEPAGELPCEFNSALKKLKALFAGALWDAKLRSCGAAWSDIKPAKSTRKKKRILREKTQEWREDSVKAIREWFPKFVDLAAAFENDLHADILRWSVDMVWEIVEKQCGIRRRRHSEPHGVQPVSRTMVFWFAAASAGNTDVNLPPLRPWKAPRWLARDDKETDLLLREQTHDLRIRLDQVVNEEEDRAEIQKAISRSGIEGRVKHENTKTQPPTDSIRVKSPRKITEETLAKQKHNESGTSLSQDQSSTTRSTVEAGRAAALTNEQVKGKRRADLVGRLIVELNALRPLMQVPEDDYPRLCRENPEYEVFKICAKHTSASQW